jgi:hypothetical protein
MRKLVIPILVTCLLIGGLNAYICHLGGYAVFTARGLTTDLLLGLIFVIGVEAGKIISNNLKNEEDGEE